ncbi:MAG: rRNA maturation RNase YbeY [Deltaproteobacteria bacterium]|jgi:rRNA maturation RNase YbeY|nr:rRNA maturation RNase YbeY [Deltaproteobacteria bacterium]
MTISITNNQNALPINQYKVKRRLSRLLKELNKSDFNLSILFCDDEQIRSLNRDFRKIDKPTNVLAFPDTQSALGQRAYLGDVAISTQTTMREAAESDLDAGERLYFYLVHALLHLIGYDHEKGPEAQLAQEAETERLSKLIKNDL